MKHSRFTLGTRLLLSYVAVCAVGIGVLFVTARLTAPNLFQERVNHLSAIGNGPRGPGPMLRADEAARVDDAMARSLNQSLLLAAGVAIVVGGLASWVLSRQLSSRARRLAEASTRLARGDYGERVPVDGPTELAEMAESFNAMAASLEGVEQRRRELIADVAHELRSPVSVLQGYVEALSDGVFEPAAPLWEKLADETSRMSRLVDELSELSRAEAGQVPIELVPVSPADAVGVVIERLRESYQHKDIRLLSEVPSATPAVLADRERLSQVLTNLFTNALSYTEPGGTVTIEVQSEGAEVVFALTDTGVGIAEEHLPHVFDRFYRVDRSRSRASGGTGIGLTIARAFARAMGGSLEASSPGEGAGSTFILRLPVAPEVSSA